MSAWVTAPTTHRKAGAVLDLVWEWGTLAPKDAAAFAAEVPCFRQQAVRMRDDSYAAEGLAPRQRGGGERQLPHGRRPRQASRHAVDARQGDGCVGVAGAAALRSVGTMEGRPDPTYPPRRLTNITYTPSTTLPCKPL